jgi:hypothetical protein
MNDDLLEQHLRQLPSPELPASWQAEIVSHALREARARASTRSLWPPLLLSLRHLFARNPFTASALSALWILILLFKASTPVDPTEKELIAHIDPNRPIYFVTLQDEIQLAQLWQDQPDQRPIP